MLGFLKSLGKAHGQKALNDVTTAIVNLDPETATAAQLDLMESDLDKVGKTLAGIRQTAIKERAEAVAAQATFDRMSAAGNNLLAKYNAETDPARKAELEKSLNGLLTKLEELKAILEQETTEAVEAESFLSETETIYREKGEALTTAKTKLEKAIREQQRSSMQLEVQQQRAESAAQLAGLRDNSGGGLNAALNALNKTTESQRAEAESLKLKVSVLTKADKGSMDDPNVLAALAEASGTSSALPFADRLKALSAPSTPAPVAAPLQIGSSNA